MRRDGGKIQILGDLGGLSKTQMDFGAAQCLGKTRAGLPATQHAWPRQGTGRVETRLYCAQFATNGKNDVRVGLQMAESELFCFNRLFLPNFAFESRAGAIAGSKRVNTNTFQIWSGAQTPSLRGAESARISACIEFLREHLAQGPYALPSSY